MGDLMHALPGLTEANNHIENISFDKFALNNGIAINIGNPHIVFFVKDLDSINIEEIGPFIENYPLFPKKINVEL